MDIELLRRLSNSFGPPGVEDEPREILKAELEGIADESWVDKLGNIFFRYRGDIDAPTEASHVGHHRQPATGAKDLLQGKERHAQGHHRH